MESGLGGRGRKHRRQRPAGAGDGDAHPRVQVPRIAANAGKGSAVRPASTPPSPKLQARLVMIPTPALRDHYPEFMAASQAKPKALVLGGRSSAPRRRLPGLCDAS